jgi:hypothetical protein
MTYTISRFLNYLQSQGDELQLLVLLVLYSGHRQVKKELASSRSWHNIYTS